jgi:hypothetical protein
MVFHVEISEIWQRKEVWRRSVVNFDSCAKNCTRLQMSVKKPAQWPFIFAYEWQLRKGHYDVAASFKLPIERWNGMYQSAPKRTRILNSRCAHVQTVSKFFTFPQFSEMYGRDPRTLQILIHTFTFTF